MSCVSKPRPVPPLLSGPFTKQETDVLKLFSKYKKDRSASCAELNAFASSKHNFAIWRWNKNYLKSRNVNERKFKIQSHKKIYISLDCTDRVFPLWVCHLLGRFATAKASARPKSFVWQQTHLFSVSFVWLHQPASKRTKKKCCGMKVGTVRKSRE